MTGEGRLDLAEYERRVVVVQAARVRKDLAPAVADLPGGSGRTGPNLRIAAADREQALVRLAGARRDAGRGRPQHVRGDPALGGLSDDDSAAAVHELT